MNTKILKKNTEELNPVIHKNTHYDQEGFSLGMQGCLNISKSNNIVHINE
jgi:hypothetical protein